MRARPLAKLVLLLLTGCLEQTLVVSDQQVTGDAEDGTDARVEAQDPDAGRDPADASGSDSSRQQSCERCGSFDTRRCSPLYPEPRWKLCVECGCCFDSGDCAFAGRDWVCAWPLGGEGTQPGRCIDPDWVAPP